MTKGVKIILSRRCAICPREGIKGNETINLAIASSMIDLCSFIIIIIFSNPTPQSFSVGRPEKNLRPFLLKISTCNNRRVITKQTHV